MYSHEKQRKQLSKWESVLKPELFDQLYFDVMMKNAKAKVPEDIVRGVDIDSMI